MLMSTPREPSVEYVVTLMNIVAEASLFLFSRHSHDGSMLHIHCPQCDRRYLVGTRSIRSMHNTSEGVIVYVRCPEGHLTINTGTASTIEKSTAGQERSLAPVRRVPAEAALAS